MHRKNDILQKVKNSIVHKVPDATIILYGSYARGDNDQNSDIDLLILLNKDKISRDDEIEISYPLYDLEFETGFIISPLILSKKDWNTRHKITPFYANVNRDGIVL